MRQLLERLHQGQAGHWRSSPKSSRSQVRNSISAIFAADFPASGCCVVGQMLPRWRARTGSLYDASRPPSIRLLPIERRAAQGTRRSRVQDTTADRWVTFPLDLRPRKDEQALSRASRR